MSLGKKVLVISPAGRTYYHDNVEWYPSPFSKIKKNYFNIGDMVVYDSTLKLLDFNQVEPMNIDVEVSNEMIEYYKTFDYVIIRASNFIHNDMNWHNAINLLEKVNLPVYAIGVGAQSSGRGSYLLNEHNYSFWKTVSERSKLIGVRGAYTADVLSKNGIKNVEIVGCPSIFRTRNRNLNIKAPNDLRRIAFSIRREADATYTSDVGKYLSIQRDLLLNFSRKYDVRVTIHGEPEEKSYYYHDLDAMKGAENEFMNSGWWNEGTRSEMDDIYRNRLFFFLKVADYDEFIKTQDFSVGYRVHGVLPALANGVPGLLVKYDSRSGELAETHSIPSVSLTDGNLDVSDLLANVDYSEFNKMYPIKYDKMKFVFDINGLSNRL